MTSSGQMIVCLAPPTKSMQMPRIRPFSLASYRSLSASSSATVGDIGGIGVNAMWILCPADGQPATPGNGVNTAFAAPNRAAVDLFHKVALEKGGTDEGAPGIRAENHPNFYAAFVRDLTGNKIVAVCNDPVEDSLV